MPPSLEPTHLLPARLPSPTAIAAWVRRHPTAVAIGACVSLFLIYAALRQRAIFGVDSFGYYQFGWNLAHGRIFLETALPAATHPALVPLGFSLNHAHRVVPNYPPGFPLLLAVGHLLGTPMLVTPVVGVVSCLLLFRLLRLRASLLTATCLTTAWAFMPLVVYGSTMLMSDLVAATALMAALLAWHHGRPAASAWLLGFSFMVRPTDVFFLGPFLLGLRFDRRVLRLLLHLIAPCALYGLYNHVLFGAPWATGYGHFSSELQPEHFATRFAFYLRMAALLTGPVVLAAAVFALRKWNREKAFLLTWPLVFMLFYANWGGGLTDPWWWARFILPGLPALYLLAADGIEAVRQRLPALPRSARAAGIALLAATPVNSIVYGVQQGDLWMTAKGDSYRETVRFAAAEIPPGSAVGSVELTSSFYVYTSLVPFLSVAETSPEFVGSMLAAGRRVYLLVEPWNTDNASIRRIFARYRTREITRFPELWRGLPLYEVTLPAAAAR